jgi:hypothetical protein
MTKPRTTRSILTLAAVGVLGLTASLACVAAPDHDDAATVPREHGLVAQDLVDAADDAEAAWDASCPGETLDGLCVQWRERGPSRDGCATPGIMEIVVRPRDEAAASRALADLDDVLEAATAAEPPSDPALRGPYEQAIERVRLARLDAQFERFVAETPDEPEALVARKIRGGESLTEAYGGFARSSDPRSAIRAALRTSWVSAHVIDAFLAAPLPDTARDDSDRAAYCAAVHERIAPMTTLAGGAAKWCLDTAAARGYDGPEPKRCDAVVAMLDRIARR